MTNITQGLQGLESSKVIIDELKAFVERNKK